MEAVEFQARIKNGMIQIPEKYKTQFENQVWVVMMIREEKEESQAAPRRKFGSAKDEVWMSDDFDEPLEMFEDYGS
jgi:hypothetical protein